MVTSKKENESLDQLNENGLRKEDRRQEDAPPAKEKRKVQRRRLIDPTTCERDYSNDEIEFMTAMDDYKRRSGRMFPTCSEILEVIRELGYIKTEYLTTTEEVVEDTFDEIESEFADEECDEFGFSSILED